MFDADVLIMGAGPTGMMLALELSRYNISYHIVDKAAIRSDKSRALAIQPRSLELLNRHGIADGLVKIGVELSGAEFHVNGRFAAINSFDDLVIKDTKYQHLIMLSQVHIEKALEKVLAANKQPIQREVSVEDIRQDSEGVSVNVIAKDGTSKTKHFKYIVGCDGAHSVVRKAAGLTFEGAAYPQDFILADLTLDGWEGPRNRVSSYMANGMIGVFPMPEGRSRLLVSRGTLGNDDEPTLADFQEAWKNITKNNATLRDPIWISRFRLSHRGVDNYRNGRMFVAGDAAHIHSPVGGQGMNTGLQDVVNLALKLSRVLHGARSQDYLDTYNIERRKVGKALLTTTDSAFKIATTQNPFWIFIRNLLIPLVMPLIFMSYARRMRSYRFVSQLSIRYRESPIVSGSSACLKGGDRAPDRKLIDHEGNETSIMELCLHPQYNLFVFGDLERIHLDWAQTHVIVQEKAIEPSEYMDINGQARTAYGVQESGYVMVRPDGYIAYIGQSVKECLNII